MLTAAADTLPDAGAAGPLREGPATPRIGATLAGRYRLEERLAVGGFGAVYRARTLGADPALASAAAGRGRALPAEVAIKVLHPSLAAMPAVAARFRREGRALARLRSAHTVAAHEWGAADDGTLFIAMELLAGETLLDAYRATGPLPWPRVAAIGRAVCSSLAEAHALGIVHRDLKPANIYLHAAAGGPPVVKVLDFGIAKVLDERSADPDEHTRAGQLVGTLAYMAPEQVLGGAVGPACDLYTLGTVMYELIAGRLPCADAATPAHLVTLLHTTAPAPLATRAAVPAALDRAVMRCLSPDPAARFGSARELACALAAALDTAAPAELSAAAPREIAGDRERTGRRQRPAPPARRAGASGPTGSTRAPAGTLPGAPRARQRATPPVAAARAAEPPPPALAAIRGSRPTIPPVRGGPAGPVGPAAAPLPRAIPAAAAIPAATPSPPLRRPPRTLPAAGAPPPAPPPMTAARPTVPRGGSATIPRGERPGAAPGPGERAARDAVLRGVVGALVVLIGGALGALAAHLG
jgi:serine/threonine-protein kinase